MWRRGDEENGEKEGKKRRDQRETTSRNKSSFKAFHEHGHNMILNIVCKLVYSSVLTFMEAKLNPCTSEIRMGKQKIRQ